MRRLPVEFGAGGCQLPWLRHWIAKGVQKLNRFEYFTKMKNIAFVGMKTSKFHFDRSKGSKVTSILIFY
jgi:hypothetical protein